MITCCEARIDTKSKLWDQTHHNVEARKAVALQVHRTSKTSFHQVSKMRLTLLKGVSLGKSLIKKLPRICLISSRGAHPRNLKKTSEKCTQIQSARKVSQRLIFRMTIAERIKILNQLAFWTQMGNSQSSKRERSLNLSLHHTPMSSLIKAPNPLQTLKT